MSIMIARHGGILHDLLAVASCHGVLSHEPRCEASDQWDRDLHAVQQQTTRFQSSLRTPSCMLLTLPMLLIRHLHATYVVNNLLQQGQRHSREAMHQDHSIVAYKACSKFCNALPRLC